jgi:hypothetical protein
VGRINPLSWILIWNFTHDRVTLGADKVRRISGLGDIGHNGLGADAAT